MAKSQNNEEKDVLKKKSFKWCVGTFMVLLLLFLPWMGLISRCKGESEDTDQTKVQKCECGCGRGCGSV